MVKSVGSPVVKTVDARVKTAAVLRGKISGAARGKNSGRAEPSMMHTPEYNSVNSTTAVLFLYGKLELEPKTDDF